VCIELSILLVPCPDFLNVHINFLLPHIKFHIWGIILQTLSFEVEVDGTLQTTSAAGDDFRISKLKSFFNLLLVFVEKIFVTETWSSTKMGTS